MSGLATLHELAHVLIGCEHPPSKLIKLIDFASSERGACRHCHRCGAIDIGFGWQPTEVAQAVQAQALSLLTGLFR